MNLYTALHYTVCIGIPFLFVYFYLLGLPEDCVWGSSKVAIHSGLQVQFWCPWEWKLHAAIVIIFFGKKKSQWYCIMQDKLMRSAGLVFSGVVWLSFSLKRVKHSLLSVGHMPTSTRDEMKREREGILFVHTNLYININLTPTFFSCSSPPPQVLMQCLPTFFLGEAVKEQVGGKNRSREGEMSGGIQMA